ncbi:RTC4-like domain-containing protein [Podospora conica]|nr:RTC4-like domain-containing protein [Schizothecium conicum]
MASAFTGMSYKQNVKPLLGTVGGRPVHSLDRQYVKEEPADDAPPLSDISDVEFEAPSISTKGDIKSTFGTSKTAGKPIEPKRNMPKRAGTKKDFKIRPRGRPGRASKPNMDLEELELQDPEPVTESERPSLKQDDNDLFDEWESRSTGSKRKAYDDDELLGGHHASAFGGVGLRRPKASKKFNRASRFKRENSSDEERPAPKVKRKKGQARPTDSPPSSPKRGGLILPSDMPDNEVCSSPRPGLKDTFSKDLFSDDKTPKRKGLRNIRGLQDTPTEVSPPKKELNLPSGALSDTSDFPKKRGIRNFRGLQDTPTAVSPPKKGLNLHSDTSDLEDARPGLFSQLPSRPRSASSSSLVELPERPHTDLMSPSASRPVCPMCNEEVDQSLIDEFRKRHPTSTWRQQQAFCMDHKKAKAKVVWKEKKYPRIDWRGLDARVTRQSSFLRGIVNGGKSHFRDIFKEKVKEAGRDRTVRRAEEYMVPGYYGGRGMRAMSERIVEDLSSALRKRSDDDELVSAARGVGAYVQSVLVPEVAVRLIMEDMDVGAEKARQIMEDSMWLGELLNEELDDVVLGDDDENEEDRSDSGLPGEDDCDSDSDSSLSSLGSQF